MANAKELVPVLGTLVRVDSLKGNAQRAAKAVKAEKARQKLVKAQEAHREAQAITHNPVGPLI